MVVVFHDWGHVSISVPIVFDLLMDFRREVVIWEGEQRLREQEAHVVVPRLMCLSKEWMILALKAEVQILSHISMTVIQIKQIDRVRFLVAVQDSSPIN